MLKDWEKGRAADGPPPRPSRVRRERKIDPWRGTIQELLERYKKPPITAERVYEKLLEQGFDGGRSIVKQAVREMRPPRVEAVERFETEPGVQGQMDWVNPEVSFLDGTTQKLKGFVYCLGFSRRMWLKFSLREDFSALVRRHVEAFEFFGGCPAECLYDNMKTVVLRWEGEVPIYNPRFLLFATHYGFRPRACRQYRPQTKGKVERPNSYIRKNFLVGRDFHDLDDLNAQAAIWNLETADTRLHGTTRERPIDRFVREEDHLLPLPGRAYDTCEVAYRIVALDALLDWGGSRYSVPPERVGEIVIVKASEHELVVLASDCREIARHELVPPGRREWRRHPAHQVRGERRGPALDILRARFVKLGERAGEYLQGLGRAHPRHTKAQIRAILTLLQCYTADDLERALEHGLRFGAFSAKVVEDHLVRNALPRSLESVIARSGPQDVDDSQTGEEVRQREASYYEELFDAYGEGGESDE